MAETESGPAMRRRPRWRLLLPALAVAALVAWVVWRWQTSGGFDFRDFFAVWTGANWGWLVLSMLVYLGAYAARAVRWGIMLTPLRPEHSFRQIFTATMIGFASLFVLGRPGEMVRPYLISVKERVPLSSQLAIWVLERIYDTLLLLIVFGCALALVSSEPRPVGATLEWLLRTGGTIAAAFSAICIAVLVGLNLWADRLSERLAPVIALLQDHHQEKATRMLDSLVSGLTSVRQVSTLMRIFGWSVLHWVVVCVCYVIGLKAFPGTAQFGVTDAVVVMGFAAFGSIVQIPGIGGGPQVACTLVLVEVFGLPLESATGISLVLYIVGFLAVVPLGLLLGLHEGLSFKKLRQLEEESRP